MAFLTSKIKIRVSLSLQPPFFVQKKERFDCLCYQYVQVLYSSEAKLKIYIYFLSQSQCQVSEDRGSRCA